jgi:NADPH2:quinone reductase
MAPTTMRAWRTHEYGRPTDVLRLDVVEVPEPGPGEIRVRVLAVPFNLNDLERVTGGNMAVRIELPYSPGMETMGIVDATGLGAEAMLGQRVVAITRQAHGGFAEYVICAAASAFEVPEAIPLPDAACLYFPFHLAWLGLFDRAGLQAGETVLIHAAAGGSGSAAIQLAKYAGARVFATIGSEAKRQLCVDLGADVVINYTTESFADIVMDETDRRGVDVVFDNVGDAVMAASMNCIAYNGRYLMMGFASDKRVADEKYIVPRRVAMANIKLCGVLLSYAADEMVPSMKVAIGANFAPASLGREIQAQIVRLVLAGAVKPVVGSVVAFEDIPAALAALADRHTVGRVVARLYD